MRTSCIVLLVGSFLSSACHRLGEPPKIEGVLDLREIPAEYGDLIAVTTAGPLSETSLAAMWFSQPGTGKITRLVFDKLSWQYDPRSIRVFERSK